MKTVIFYFTGTGNTMYVSDYLAMCLNENNIVTQSLYIVDITQNQIDKLIDENDIIFLAYPIYGSDMPENMKSFIDKMPNGNSKKIGVICTQFAFSGDGASIMFRQLKHKGYNQRWSYQINMPNNLCVKGSPLKQSDDYNVHEKKHLIKARKKIDKICHHIIENKKRVLDNTIFHKALALTQRPYYKKFGREHYAKNLNVNMDKCIKCGLCAKNCPNQVISMDIDGIHFNDRDNCTVCLRCLNFCNESAITYNGNVKEPLYKGPTKEIYNKIF